MPPTRSLFKYIILITKKGNERIYRIIIIRPKLSSSMFYAAVSKLDKIERYFKKPARTIEELFAAAFW